MEAVVERQNMIKALQQVKRNKGQGGIDGMSVTELERLRFPKGGGLFNM